MPRLEEPLSTYLAALQAAKVGENAMLLAMEAQGVGPEVLRLLLEAWWPRICRSFPSPKLWRNKIPVDHSAEAKACFAFDTLLQPERVVASLLNPDARFRFYYHPRYLPYRSRIQEILEQPEWLTRAMGPSILHFEGPQERLDLRQLLKDTCLDLQVDGPVKRLYLPRKLEARSVFSLINAGGLKALSIKRFASCQGILRVTGCQDLASILVGEGTVNVEIRDCPALHSVRLGSRALDRVTIRSAPVLKLFDHALGRGRVGLHLDFEDCGSLEFLTPDGGGDRDLKSLRLVRCPGLKTLPRSVLVHGDLEIEACPGLDPRDPGCRVRGRTWVAGRLLS